MPRGPDREYSNRDILRYFVQTPDPVLFVSEVAEKFDKSGEWARKRLNELVENGYLNKKKPGRRSVVYWITPEGHSYWAENSDTEGSQ